MAFAKPTAAQRKTLAAFKAEANRLKRAVAGLSEKELDYAPTKGQWTIRQIVHHIVDANHIELSFFNNAIATPGVEIREWGFPGNEVWAEALAFDKRPIQASVALIVSQYRFIAEAAAYFCDDWEREVVFLNAEGKEAQRVTAGQIITMLSEHLAEHVAAIEAIKHHHKIQSV